MNVNIVLMRELLNQLPSWLANPLHDLIDEYLRIFSSESFSGARNHSVIGTAWAERPKLSRNEENEIELEVRIEDGADSVSFYPYNLQKLYERLELLKEDILFHFKMVHDGPRKRSLMRELEKMFQDNSWMKDNNFILELMEHQNEMMPRYIDTAAGSEIYSYYFIDKNFAVWFNELNCISETCCCESHDKWKDPEEISIQALYEGWKARK